MPKRTQVVHEGDRFLVAEEPGDAQRPNLRVFAHEDNSTVTAASHAPRYETEEDGWRLLAQVVEGALLTDPEADGDVELLRKLLKRYLWERAEASARTPHPYWYVQVHGRPTHSLDRGHRRGLSLPLYTRKEDAQKSLAESGHEGEVLSTGVLREFLIFRAEEGYAGATLDGSDFVFWCTDKNEEMQFLKLRPDADQSDVEGHLLDGDGGWKIWEGDRSLEFFEDPDAWDRLMTEILGPIPFLDYSAEMDQFALFRSGGLLVVDDKEFGETAMAPVFLAAEGARRFAQHHELEPVEVSSIHDLREFVSDAATLDAVTRIEPNEHRARGGALWIRDGRLVLDSFSGFWDSEDGTHFRLLS